MNPLIAEIIIAFLEEHYPDFELKLSKNKAGGWILNPNKQISRECYQTVAGINFRNNNITPYADYTIISYSSPNHLLALIDGMLKDLLCH